MKKFLIDTQAFIWMMNSPEHLTKTALQHISQYTAYRYVSIASPWEMAIKVSIGKLQLAHSIQEIILDYASILEFLPIQAHHLAVLEKLPLHHRDPFDRIIIAQALAEHLPIVSSDAAFDVYGIERIWE